MLRKQKEQNSNTIEELPRRINSLEESFKVITDTDIPMSKSAIQELLSQPFSRIDMLNSRRKIANLKSGVKNSKEKYIKLNNPK